MTASRQSIKSALRVAGESARGEDVSTAAVARVQGEAGRILAARPRPVVASVGAAAWHWQPLLGYGVAALLLATVVTWRTLRVAPGERAEPVVATAAVVPAPAPLERMVAEGTDRLREDLRAFRQRYVVDPRAAPRSRAEELAEAIAIRSGRLRAELSTADQPVRARATGDDQG